MTGTSSPRALWITSAGIAAHRTVADDASGDTPTIKTLFTGISRGTERLVFEGRVPLSEHSTMKAPFQSGEFSFPVKYGYSAVGRVQNGAQAGATVFALFPHQSQFHLPADATILVPDTVPAARAVLAANMETALNIVWDAGISAGDKVTVVGCGVIGALTAYLAARIIGTEVCVVDVDETRAALAQTLGFAFSTPDQARGDADIVVHTSATASGLTTAITAAGLESKVVEASWYGTGTTAVPLGGAFHQRRLQIIGSQVGRIPHSQTARWTYRRRLQKAISLLVDPALDALISGETHFDDLPDRYGDILKDPATLCHRVRYDD